MGSGALELGLGWRLLSSSVLIVDPCTPPPPPQRDVDHDFVGDACDSDQDQ